MTTTLHVGLDADDVLYPWMLTKIGVLAAKSGRPVSDFPAPTVYGAYAQWPSLRGEGRMDREEFREHCAEAIDAGQMLCVGEPIPGSREAWLRIHQAGHAQHVITARATPFERGGFGREETEKGYTLDWLDRYFPEYASVTFTKDKTQGPAVDYMLEDHLGHYDALTEHGVRAVLLNTSWNQVPGDDRVRVDTHDQFADLVLGVTPWPGRAGLTTGVSA